jgi:hypothetical protein
MKNVSVNKYFAISKCEHAIRCAEEYLRRRGEEPAYYSWHKNTIEKMRERIEEIRREPVTMWN